MITFGRHLEITKHLSKHDTLIGYLGNLEPAERIEVTRSIADVYPLNNTIEGHFDALDNFKCYRSIDELVLGQFIMVEQIITGKTNYESTSENDFEIAKLLMRPKEHDVFDNENPEVEKQNAINILNTNVLEVYSVLQQFLTNREFVLFKQFKGVFYELSEDDDDDEQQEYEKTGEALFQQQWYWYSMVRMLAKEDITKYDEIYMLKMSTVMPEMSYLAQKNKIDATKHRQQEALRKL